MPSKFKQMHHFTPETIFGEEIFIPRNLDWECDRLAQMLFGYGEKFIEPALEDDLALIEQTEACQNYGIPSGIPLRASSEMRFQFFGNEDARSLKGLGCHIFEI